VSRHHTTLVEVLTPENWRSVSRMRVMAGYWMSATVESAEEGYRVVYGVPERGLGTETSFDTLEEALAFANRDTGGVSLWLGEDGVEVSLHLPLAD
jgi:hypothetical protein